MNIDSTHSKFGPNGEAVRELLESLPRFHWLRPEGDEASDEIIGQLVAEHINALNEYGSVKMPQVRIESDLTKALDAARAAAWDATMDEAMTEAMNAARAVVMDAAAMDAAGDAARAVAWHEARNAARAAAMDAAGDAAGAAAYLASGLGKANPWGSLMELWARGTWPVGYLRDGQFLVYRPHL